MLIMDNLKLKELRKHYTKEIDAIKQAIINELNRCYKNTKRRFLYVEQIKEIDDYFRIEVVYIDYFISGPIKDVGIYYVNKEVI